MKKENGRKLCGSSLLIEYAKTKPWSKSTRRSRGDSRSENYGFRRRRGSRDSRSRSRGSRSRSRSERRSRRKNRSSSRSRSRSRSRSSRERRQKDRSHSRRDRRHRGSSSKDQRRRSRSKRRSESRGSNRAVTERKDKVDEQKKADETQEHESEPVEEEIQNGVGEKNGDIQVDEGAEHENNVDGELAKNDDAMEADGEAHEIANERVCEAANRVESEDDDEEDKRSPTIGEYLAESARNRSRSGDDSE